MSFKYVVIGGFAAVLLSTAAWAQDDTDTYVCNDRLCYDDQADETRRLNLEQLENGGYIAPDDYDDADDMQGQGGPYFESEDDANQSGAYSDDDAYDDDDGYGDDDDMAPPDDDYDDE